jgi:hypothetical protein
MLQVHLYIWLKWELELNPEKIYRVGATTECVADAPSEGLGFFTEELQGPVIYFLLDSSLLCAFTPRC